MPEHDAPLQIEVDSEVHLPSESFPRKALDALRRQLRQHETRHPPKAELRRLLNLVQSKRGAPHRLPQALLSRVTETCRRYQVPFKVVDRRAMVACPAIRSQADLSDEEQKALRQLLLRESGVLVAPARQARCNIAAELIARHQQRSLLLTATKEAAERWIEELGQLLQLQTPHLSPLGKESADSLLVVGSYRQMLRRRPNTVTEQFGMVVCDDLDGADASEVMRTVRQLSARYLLGLASEATRPDGLHSTLFLSLGDVAARLAPPRHSDAMLRLAITMQNTSFDFPGYAGRQQYQALLAALAADEKRATLVARDIEEEAIQGRCCLVLSERRDHLEQLQSLVPAGVTKAVLSSALRPAERQALMVRFEQGELQVLFATRSIAQQAMRSSRIERIFIAFPFAYSRKIEPLLQRLVTPYPGQQAAVVYDYDDPKVDPLHRAFLKRKSYLSKFRRMSERAAQLSLPI